MFIKGCTRSAILKNLEIYIMWEISSSSCRAGQCGCAATTTSTARVATRAQCVRFLLILYTTLMEPPLYCKSGRHERPLVGDCLNYLGEGGARFPLKKSDWKKRHARTGAIILCLVLFLLPNICTTIKNIFLFGARDPLVFGFRRTQNYKISCNTIGLYILLTYLRQKTCLMAGG